MDEITKRINAFERKCRRGEYTDTDDAWSLLYWIKAKATRHAKILEHIAWFTKDGEMIDGHPFVLEDDVAVSSLHHCIDVAREIVGPEKKKGDKQ